MVRFERLRNAGDHAVGRGVVGTLDGPFERVGVGRAVTLDDQPTQTEQRGAIVAPMINAPFETRQHRQRHDSEQLGEPRAAEFLAQHLTDHLGQSFGALERHVADKAVADNDVGRALEDVVAFNVAEEVEIGGAQQLTGLLNDLVALDDFFANVEQTDRWTRLLLDHRHHRRGHLRKLQQVLGLAVGVGTKIQHGRAGTFLVRDGGGNCRAVNAVQRLENVTRHGHQRAGVAGGNARLSGAFLELIDGHAH